MYICYRKYVIIFYIIFASKEASKPPFKKLKTMGTKLTQFLLESALSIYVFAMIAICLLIRWIFPGKPSWETHYLDMVDGYDKVAERNNFWATEFPNMPLDVRLWNVLRDLEDEYDVTQDESLVDMIYKLRKLHNKTPYMDVREM